MQFGILHDLRIGRRSGHVPHCLSQYLRHVKDLGHVACCISQFLRRIADLVHVPHCIFPRSLSLVMEQRQVTLHITNSKASEI